MGSPSNCSSDSPSANEREVPPNQDVGASVSSLSRKRAKQKQVSEIENIEQRV